MKMEKVQKLYQGITQTEDAYIEEAEHYERKKEKRTYLKIWAACALLGILGGLLYRGFYPQKSQYVVPYPVEPEEAGREVLEEEASAAYVDLQIGNRVASYEEMSTDSEKLKKYIGEVYEKKENCVWYYLKGEDNLKQLLCQNKDGSLELYEFDEFIADGFYEEKDGKKRGVEKWFPDADFSPYSCGEVLEKIYDVRDTQKIASITVGAYRLPYSQDSNEKRIEKEIGKRTFTDRKDISAIYEILADVFIYGGEDDDDVQVQGPVRYSYSFSEDTEYAWFYARRLITITLKDGTVIDNWKYDALRGRIYDSPDYYTVPLSDKEVLKLNELFDIR